MPVSGHTSKRIVEAMRYIARAENQQGVLPEAEVVSVHNNFLKIKIKGAPGLYLVEKPSQADIAIGDRILVARSSQDDRWIFVNRIAQGTISAADAALQTIALAQPANATSLALPNAIIWKWDAHPAAVLNYHVQVADDSSGTNAVDYYVGGTTFVYAADYGAQKYLRVRGVQTNFQASAWSNWVAGTPDTNSAITADLPAWALSGKTPEETIAAVQAQITSWTTAGDIKRDLFEWLPVIAAFIVQMLDADNY